METSKTNSCQCKNDDVLKKEEGDRMFSKLATPTLDLNPLRFHESTYNSYGNSYDAPTLVQFAKDKNYPVFDMPIVGIDMSELPFEVNSFAQFVWQLSRIQNTDLSHPILLDDHGTICDGWHRVAKAVMEGRTTIKAIRLQEMPAASGKADSK